MARFCAQWLLKYTVVETLPCPHEMLIFCPLGEVHAADLRCTAAFADGIRLVAVKRGTIMAAMPTTTATIRILCMVASLRSPICAPARTHRSQRKRGSSMDQMPVTVPFVVHVVCVPPSGLLHSDVAEPLTF